jgi:hypothetical protein
MFGRPGEKCPVSLAYAPKAADIKSANNAVRFNRFMVLPFFRSPCAARPIRSCPNSALFQFVQTRLCCGKLCLSGAAGRGLGTTRGGF